jgi:ribonuclease Y
LFTLLGLAALGGAALGYVLRWLLVLARKGSIEIEVKQIMLDAQVQAQKITEEADTKAKEVVAAAEASVAEKTEKVARAEERVFKREEALDKKQGELDQEIQAVKGKIEEIRGIKERADALLTERANELAKVAGLTKDEARAQLMQEIEREADEDFMMRAAKLERDGHERLERKAREILTTAIHRLGNSVASDTMATAITIPNDELKGKIIGKEGRNIRQFERSTGVDVIIDDTPGTLTLSSYDPIRRQIARIALENLILDGRIQPAKIEEAVQKAEQEINNIIKKKGAEAAYEAKVPNLDPKLLMILGRLYFRTSYGQNVLDHSVEVAHLAAMLAAELGADEAVARAGALFHDVGKAVDHEVPGTHVEIGRRILQKFGVDEAVIKAMQAHHEEYPYETPESMIVQVADAISGGRPGARRDSVENYIKRLEELEAIANNEHGVEKSFAISAGRELRVIIKPEQVTDLEARKLARDIADKIEKELQYPGEIKVSVIRETRVIEYAK